MSNETYLNPNVSADMTFRVGTLDISRAELLDLLGDPHYSHGDKTTMEWLFQTPDGVATVYDYWWNDEGEWSIGGYNNLVVNHIKAYIQTLREE